MSLGRAVRQTVEGGCSCGCTRYRMSGPPMIVHCCHCSWCQRESGSAFVLNALIESTRVQLVAGDIEQVETPSASGAGQQIARCARCHTALWSHYAFAGIGEQVTFVRVGTLEDPGRLPPDVHIYASSKLPWLVLGEDAQVFPDYYRAKEVWSRDSLERKAELVAALTGQP